MKIPESVRIAGVEYTVRGEPHLNDGVSVACGVIDHEKSEILL